MINSTTRPYVRMADISGNGVIVMTGDSYATTSNTSYWYEQGTLTKIQREGEGGAFAYGISESGVALISVAGDTFTATSPTQRTPLPAHAEGSAATAISPNGRVVTGAVLDDPDAWYAPQNPLRWDDGVLSELTSPSSTHGYFLGVTSVNDSGAFLACGSDMYDWPYHVNEATWSYAADGKPSQLSPLPGSTDVCAKAINNDGVIVGDAGSKATLWVNGQARALNSLVPNRSGYSLQTAEDINAAGQIVGLAKLADGSNRGYIATPSTAETIYTAPGYHDFNGRAWKTTCEPYSRTTRCRREIVATQVQYKNGGYSRVTDWAFNNLTYTPSPRSLWARNPLGNTGEWTADDGRKWRTECDTPTTGKNGCRSYVFARVADATPKPGGGYTYTVESMWVFNNMVKFG
ncbi:hypothetical protein FOJ82_08710 [Tessaracoccus rhinocerotis]|uniref:Uncharacterized protein n=1 Tax=Tessaracoccus rhinocerotis TaxID=1689449 RepID=A0A553K0A1_9ACTN|nr:hypothetical protein [Tessaracoccus rhinocerotis]TRY18129.1 hypothetical protein FOJ82_08710 [Tessaracoccus rhinocerotis]